MTPPAPAEQPTTDGYEVVDTQQVYTSRFNRIRIDTVRMPDGTTADREIVDHLSAVGAVPIDDDDHVVLLEQYRHAFGRKFLEIPAGKLDVEGEDPAEGMRRELVEEIEMTAERLEPLLTFNNSAGWNSEQTTVYLATGLSPSPHPDDFEPAHEEADMTVLRVRFDEAVEMVHTGRIVDAKTVVGLLALADRRRRE